MLDKALRMRKPVACDISGFASRAFQVIDYAQRQLEMTILVMKIALGVSGGIAAYKSAEIVRLLQDRGVRVQVVMTRAAQEFIRPLTFAALSGEKVITDLFGAGRAQANVESAIEHIAVAQTIDALLVAPATADVLAKFAQGIANDFLSTLYLATTAPVVVAPAMNVNMWNHPATQANLEILRKRGVRHCGAGQRIPGLRHDRSGTAG
jgi:phosphopantothenoylcysteine decarboxylase / phosphopantothenate---cysteine ligase